MKGAIAGDYAAAQEIVSVTTRCSVECNIILRPSVPDNPLDGEKYVESVDGKVVASTGGSLLFLLPASRSSLGDSLPERSE